MKFYIENKDYFETIFEKGTANYKKLWSNLFNGKYEIEDDYLTVAYDDCIERGYAQFEVISQGPIWIKLTFLSTYK